MFRTFRIPLSWTELFKQTTAKFISSDCLGLAAQVAYYFLLGLVPALICLVAIASFLPPSVIGDSLSRIPSITPPEIATIIRGQLRELTASPNGGLLTFGFVMALWTSSTATVAIVETLNRAYDIDEGHPWWMVRLEAIGLTVALALFILIGSALVLAGPAVADWLAVRTGMGQAFAIAWKILQWPFVFVLITIGIGLLNHFAPDAYQDWEWVTPGAVLTTLLWFLGSLAFRIYVVNFNNYNETYGALGGLILMMLWFYLTGLAILAGAVMNAVIERSSPHSRAGLEIVPGQKKLLGARAARAFEKKEREKLRRPMPAALQPRSLPQPATVIDVQATEPEPVPARVPEPDPDPYPQSDPRPRRSARWLVAAAEIAFAIWAIRRARADALKNSTPRAS